MAITGTSTSGTFTVGQIVINLTSSTGIKKKMLLKVDSEVQRVTDDSLAPAIQVVPGYAGTIATSHNAGALVAYGLPADFAGVGLGAPLTSVSVNGPIPIPISNTIVLITKAGVAALTLAAPGLDQNGLRLVINSNTANAHTVTATGLFQDGSTTTDVATFAAHPGASMEIVAVGGKWNAVSSTGITYS